MKRLPSNRHLMPLSYCLNCTYKVQDWCSALYCHKVTTEKEKRVKKMAMWTDGLTLVELETMHKSVNASVEHWFLRKMGDEEEIEKADGASCPLCKTYANVCRKKKCPIQLREDGKSCLLLPAYNRWENTKYSISSDTPAIGAVGMYDYLVTMQYEINEAITRLQTPDFGIGDRVEISCLNEGDSCTGEVVGIAPKKQPEASAFVYPIKSDPYVIDVKRDDEIMGFGVGRSYRIYEKYKPEIKRLTVKYTSPTVKNLREENAKLKKKIEALTGMKFSDRMYTALKSRVERAEALTKKLDRKLLARDEAVRGIIETLKRMETDFNVDAEKVRADLNELL